MLIIHLVAIHAILVLAGGFITYHFARKYPSIPLKIAAWILIIGGALILLCNMYYGVRHWNSGYPSRALPDDMPMHRQSSP